MIREETKSGDSSLHDWFTKSRASDGTPGWVQLGGKYAGKPCAKQPGQTTKPKCGSSKMKKNLTKDEEESAFLRKNRQDPNPDRRGKAKNVATEETKKDHEYSMARSQLKTIKNATKRLEKKMGKSGEGNLEAWVQSKITKSADYIDTAADYVTNEEAGEKDACYKKVKSRYKVWPSAYASGALVKCRKKGASNWGNKSEEFTPSQILALEANGYSVDEGYKNLSRKAGVMTKQAAKAGMSAGAAQVGAKALRTGGVRNAIRNTLGLNAKERSHSGADELDAKAKRARNRAAKIIAVQQSHKPGVSQDKEKINREKGIEKNREKIQKAYDQSESFTIDPTAHRKAQKKAKIGNLSRNTDNPGEKAAAENKSKGPKLFGETITIKEEWDNYWSQKEEFVNEAVRLPAKTGNIVMVNLTWRGRYYGIKIFFPHTKVPNRTEVQYEIEKVYPGARVYSFQVSDYEPGQPLIHVSEGAAWTKKEGKSESGGLNEKGRKSYERENPGSDLKAPSKEVGNPRRDSFCARMRGMKKKLTSAKTANDPDSRINKSLRAWNC